MFDPNTEPAARTRAVEMVTREQALEKCQEILSAESIAQQWYSAGYVVTLNDTIVALYADAERLVEALSDVMDWCTDDRRLPMDLFGVANAALAKHREVFGE